MRGTEPAGEGAGRLRSLFGMPDFLRLWLVGLVLFVVRWIELLAVAVFVYERTGSAFMVAALTMLRMLPMSLFGAYFGAVADRWERRTALIVMVLLMTASSVALAVLAFAGALEVWHLAVASFVNGMGWATDNPVRRLMIGDVVGPDRVGIAMSIEAGSNNASRIFGPTLGGVMLATVGIGGAFLLGVALYAGALVAAFGVRYRIVPGAAGAGSVLLRIAEGVRLVRRDRRLVGIMVITAIFNLFGWPFTSMIPVIGQSKLLLGAEGVGLLASMEGLGAFCGAVAIALWGRPAQYGRLYAGGLASYLAMLTLFALAPEVLLAGVALFLTGFGGAGFGAMQATLVYLAAPAEMRGRILGVLSVCIGLGPLGFLHIGLLADAIGAPAATAVSGAEGLVALALTWRWWGGLVRRRGERGDAFTAERDERSQMN